MTDEQLCECLTLRREVVNSSGTCIWYNELGERHRVHGPALSTPDGTHMWYQNGVLHREGGPAVVWPDGDQHWYWHGHLHRTDGPAMEHSDGRCIWFTHGVPHTLEPEW